MPMATRGYLIIAVIVTAIILGVAVLAASVNSTPKPSKAGLAVVTLTSEVGVDAVKIVNMNTGTSIIKEAIELTYQGYSFNCTKGDTLQFSVYTLEGYVFNAWTFNTGTFDQHNPLTLQVTENTRMRAEMLILPIETATPTPASTPTPTT